MRTHASTCEPISTIELRMLCIRIGVRYAKASLNTAHTLIVRLDDGERNGWGEVFCPAPDLMWEWAGKRATSILGQPAHRLDDLLTPEPTGRPDIPPEQCGTYFHPEVDAVAEAFSIALHDLEARRRGIPFRELLGTPRRTEIPGMPVIGLSNATAMAEAGAAWADAGVQYIKVKLSGILPDDIKIVEEVCRKLPEGVEVQVDANGSYRTLKDAQPIIHALNDNHVDVIEDLFDVGNLELCKQARHLLQGQYMVDKDAHWPKVRLVLEAQAADLINQHPHNQGSMSNALRIAQAADEAGTRTAIGSSGIAGIQSAAFQQLAAVIGLSRPCEDISMMPYYEGPVRNQFAFESPPTVLQDPIVFRNGRLQLNDAPGLGIAIDPKALDRLTEMKTTISL